MNGTAYILGAGFSHYAGLPLQSEIHEGNCLQLAITVQDRAARASKTHPFYSASVHTRLRTRSDTVRRFS